MPICEIAIPTWNRRDEVVRAVESALTQDVDGLRIAVYDNASTDDTVELLESKFGDAITVHAWSENRGRHANMTRAFDTDADYMMLLMDDEELQPGAVASLMHALDEHQDAAFAFGRFVWRDGDGTVLGPSNLMAPADFRPPPVQTGIDWIRSACDIGDYTWICTIMFARKRIGSMVITERDAPCDDSGLLLRTALTGDVAYVDLPVTTKTDGNAGESVREGLVVEDADAVGHLMTIPGMVGYRRMFERFVMNEGRDAFDLAEQRDLLKRVDVLAAGLMGDEIANVYNLRGLGMASGWFREALMWITSPRSRLRLIRRTVVGGMQADRTMSPRTARTIRRMTQH